MIDSLKNSADTLIYNEKLNNLNPIFIPEPIQFEFVTLGWYILLGILLVFFFFIFLQLIKVYMKNQYRRDIINNLKIVKNDIGKISHPAIIEQVSSLLKLASFKSYGRNITANLSGENWKEFLLNKIYGKLTGNSFNLLSEQYSSNTENFTEEKLNELIDLSIIWVRRHSV